MQRDVFDSLSPIDYRYWDNQVAYYLSENGFTRYKLLVELALVEVLQKRGLCDQSVVEEVTKACEEVTTAEVYEEEERVRHDIRALVNRIQARVSESSRPFVHLTATSYDTIDSANARRYRDVTLKVLLPRLKELIGTLIGIVEREAEVLQIGRTHGQHAVPITFGFALAQYVSRLGQNYLNLSELEKGLVGKFAGAVGAYNASSLFFSDPEEFEREVLAELGLEPAEISTQIVPPEAMTRLLCETTITAGILANLADDLRHLQRTEIGEVGEEFLAEQVGSSTMPQKRNPVSPENVKSCWEIVSPRVVTAFMDQISEHQRDLTNSASSRTYGETFSYVAYMLKRLNGVLKKLKVNQANMSKNLAMQKGLIVAEPLYIILAGLGHSDAHEKVRQLTLTAQSEGKDLGEIASADAELRPYWERMSESQRSILLDPEGYTGIAARKALAVAKGWRERLF